MVRGAHVALPSAVEEIDPAWMTTALQARHPGVVVEQVHILEVIPGSATKVRLSLDYGAVSSGLPHEVVVKAGFDELMRQLAGELYRNEAVFFDRVADHLDIPLPRCFHAAVSPNDGKSVVVLEDLVAAGATFGHIASPLSPEQAAALLELLASLHAAFWGRTDRSPARELTGAAAGQRQVLEFLLGSENWERCRSLGRLDGLPASVQDRERVSSAIFALLDDVGDAPTCLIHGDAHLGNLYFDSSGSPRLLDWQAAQAGRWEADVSYFIICALDTEVRRAHERALLEHYVERLSAQGGVGLPTLEDAWDAHVRHAVYGLLGLLCTPEMQSEEFARTMGARFAWAVEDLGTLAADDF